MVSIFGFKSKEELQEKIASMEREIDILKTKLGKEKSDRELLQKQLQKGSNFSIESLQELDRYREKMEEYFGKMKFYELVVKRYKEFIEENETISIPELKSKVNPDYEIVQKKISSFDVDYEKEPLDALELSKKFLDSIKTVEDAGVEFWMAPEDIEKYNIADKTCKAVLLCSFAVALEFEAKVLVCQMTDGSKKPLVIVDTESRSILLDPDSSHNFYQYSGDSSAVLADFECNEGKISKVLYEFNDRDYITHDE